MLAVHAYYSQNYVRILFLPISLLPIFMKWRVSSYSNTIGTHYEGLYTSNVAQSDMKQSRMSVCSIYSQQYLNFAIHFEKWKVDYTQNNDQISVRAM